MEIITSLMDSSRKMMHKISHLLGEDYGIEPESLSSKSKAQQTLELNPQEFETLLPYESFDDGIFYNKETMGFGYHVCPKAGADLALVKAHANILQHKLPQGVYLNVMLYKHHFLCAPLMRGYSAILDKGGMYTQIAKMGLRYHLNAIKSGYKNKKNIPANLSDYSCYLFVYVKKSDGALLQLNNLRKVFESELSVASYAYQRMLCADLKILTRALVSPNINETSWPDGSLKDDVFISKDTAKLGTTYLVNDDSIDIKVKGDDSKAHQTKIINLSVEKFPKQFALWSTPDLYANIFSPDKGIQCPFLISFTVKGVDINALRDEAKSKAESLKKNNNSVQRFLNPNLVEEEQEWQYVYEESNKGNLSLNPAFYNVVLFSNEEDEMRDVAQTISAYREFGFELVQKSMGSWVRYLSSLPMYMTDSLFDSLQRLNHLHRQTHTTLANLMPLIADFKGARQGMMLPTYRNQISYVDTFDSKNLPLTNYNFVVSGSPGSGKSFFTQYDILSRLANGQSVFVIDLGDSYKHLCEQVGGTYLNASNIALNPFTLFDFDGEVEIDGKVVKNHTQIRDLLAIMASPNEPVSAIQNDYLLEVTLLCWNKTGNRTCMDDVIDTLREMMQCPENQNDPRLSDLVVHLKKFARKGIYGDMFNSDTPFISNKNMVVLEMGEFENNPELLTIIMFVMIVVIQGQFYHSGRDKKKVCIIDEAWRFLAQGSNPIAARFIEQGFRTARKYNAGFGVIFQQLTDMEGSAQGRAVASCSDTKFIMRQGDFQDYINNNPKVFNEQQQTLIQSFGEAAEQGFSNVMVQYGNGYTFHRFFADPFSRVLFSSNGEEFSAVEKFREQGLTLEQAVYKVAEINYGDEL